MNEKETKKIMLIYPPGKLYQRGEERCQSNIESSTATVMRAANDLGYAASVLKQKGFEVFLKDYQSENLDFEAFLKETNKFNPDVIFLSTTNATIFSDIEIINLLKKEKTNLVTILKGALFFNPEEEMLNQLDLTNIDYLIGGESEFIIGDLIYSHYFDKNAVQNIRGILYKQDSKFVKTDFCNWEEDLDKFPFPDRSLMNNSLYLRPDTGEMQATITTSRGCPSSCIFCLTPVISGKKVRFRSPQNILEELKECYFKHNIKNFFFKSDTFTINKNWTIELCNLIMDSELNGKIKWSANSRVNPIDQETLLCMKKAGCWLIAFGFESGSSITLEKIKKGANIEQSKLAVKAAKNAGLKIFGFYLIGFPWESEKHLNDTKKLMLELDTDFVELHIALPFWGTPLYEIAKQEGLIDKQVLGKDYFNAPTLGTKFLKIKELEDFRKKTLLAYHLRPSYILKKLKDAMGNPKVLVNYYTFGIRLIKNLIY